MTSTVVEGVRDRVGDLADADARDLQFPSATFDVVVSNLTIHNIADTEGRRQALPCAVSGDRVATVVGSQRLLLLHLFGTVTA